MKPEDLADATARALDLLPPSDTAHSDPRFARDPRLVVESRLTREAATDVWLAVSPLHIAPPEVLHAVMEEIRPHATTVSRGRRYLPWLAASGWAAAAVVAFLLWPKFVVTKPDATATLPVPVEGESMHPSAPSQPPPLPATRDVRLRQEIVRLQERLAVVGKDSAPVPRVLSLHAPGAPRRTPEEARQRVQSILTAALRSALEAESGAPSDAAELVIERGWPVPQGDGVVRHRHFPEASWQELGLLRSANGEYYDPVSKTVWTSEPDGKSFLGRKTTEGENLAGFAKERDPSVVPAPKPRAVPEGFVIENPAENTAEVVIDQLPAPPAGMEQVIVLTDLSGHTTTLPVPGTTAESGLANNTAIADADGYTANFSLVAPTSTTGTMVFTLLGSNGIGSFQLVERPLAVDGTFGRVLVEGGP
ncbi:MAG: hypothetical protein ABIT37_11620 [Luteolibacter sp.]